MSWPSATSIFFNKFDTRETLEERVSEITKRVKEPLLATLTSRIKQAKQKRRKNSRKKMRFWDFFFKD